MRMYLIEYENVFNSVFSENVFSKIILKRVTYKLFLKKKNPKSTFESDFRNHL